MKRRRLPKGVEPHCHGCQEIHHDWSMTCCQGDRCAGEDLRHPFQFPCGIMHSCERCTAPAADT